MKKINILVALAALLTLVSCVHEFPDPVDAEVKLRIQYDTELPIYQIVDWVTKSSSDPEDYDTRYVIKAFPETRRGDFSTTASKTWVFTEADVTELNYEVSLFIAEGNYKFMVWTDFVPAGTQTNYFYNSDNFGEIIENTTYCGNNDMRDCYRGWTTVDVVRFGSEVPPVSGVIEMSRAIAKFTFESTDLIDFLTKEARTKTEKGDTKVEPSDIDLSEYKIIFYYTGFKPSAFNMHSDRPNDSRTGIRFQSNIQQIDEGTAYLGFDYCFSNSDETTVNMAIGVYDKDNTEVSLINGIDVPLQKGKHTIIRGRFMTQESYGGVAINPEFDGEFNITI